MPSLKIPKPIFEELREQMNRGPEEQVGFLYAAADGDCFTVTELYRVPPEGFAAQSPQHLALSDDVRAKVLSHAWSHGGGLIEAHSHPGARSACFSPTDLSGLDEWVPHVRWRLQGAPYVALVFAADDFDALVWSRESPEPQPLDSLYAGERKLRPSNLTSGFLLGEQ
jgi:hypothetical protein